MRFDEAFLHGFNNSFDQSAGAEYTRQADARRSQADDARLDKKLASDAALLRLRNDFEADQALQARFAREKEVEKKLNSDAESMRQLRESKDAFDRQKLEASNQLRESQEYNLHFDNASKALGSLGQEQLAGLGLPIYAKLKSGRPLSVREQAYYDAAKFHFDAGMNPMMDQVENLYPDGTDGKPDSNQTPIGHRKRRVPVPDAPKSRKWDAVMEGASVYDSAPAKTTGATGALGAVKSASFDAGMPPPESYSLGQMAGDFYDEIYGKHARAAAAWMFPGDATEPVVRSASRPVEPVAPAASAVPAVPTVAKPSRVNMGWFGLDTRPDYVEPSDDQAYAYGPWRAGAGALSREERIRLGREKLHAEFAAMSEFERDRYLSARAKQFKAAGYPVAPEPAR